MNSSPPLSAGLDEGRLAGVLQETLRRTLFSGVRGLSPRRLSQISRETAASFIGFCDAEETAVVETYGQSLAMDGLGSKSVLLAMETLRQFCQENTNSTPDLPAVAGRYAVALLEGFIDGREKRLLEDQERTHQAYRRALERQ